MKKLLILLAPVLLSACSAKMDDLDQFIVEVKQTTPVSIEPQPKFTTMPAFKYTAADGRSPFQRPKNVQLQVQQNQRSNCTQPDFERPKQALEKFGSDALAVIGMFNSQGRQWALIQANDGSLHKATTGDHLGLFFGKISSIENGTVSFTEMLPDGAGCWQVKQAKLSMNSKAGEKTNV
jgi:type IV pilus assembly protein PilP